MSVDAQKVDGSPGVLGGSAIVLARQGLHELVTANLAGANPRQFPGRRRCRSLGRSYSMQLTRFWYKPSQ